RHEHADRRVGERDPLVVGTDLAVFARDLGGGGSDSRGRHAAGFACFSRSRCSRSRRQVRMLSRSSGTRSRLISATFGFRTIHEKCRHKSMAPSSSGISLMMGPNIGVPSPPSSTIVGTPNALYMDTAS